MRRKPDFPISFILVLILCLICSAVAQAKLPRAVGLWNFNENTIDSGKGSNNGTLVGTASIVVDPQRNKCLELDGDGYMDIPSGVTELGDADFTIAAWIKTTKIGVPILSKSNGNGEWEENEKEFYIANSETSEFENDGTAEYVGNGCDWIRGEESINDGKWHHVAVTWNFSEEEGLAYIDGTESTGEVSFVGESDNDGDTIRIGSADGGHSTGNFIGRIDNVAIFDVTLTPGQVVELMGPMVAYKGGATLSSKQDKDKPKTLDTDPNLACWLKFDEVSGKTAADSSKHQRNGKLRGGLSFNKDSVSGRVGKALQFDGGNDYIEITKYKGITGTQPRTLAAWVKTSNCEGEIISWGSDDYGKMWIFRHIRERIGVTPNGGYLYINDATDDDVWHHVAAVVEEVELPNLHDDVKLYKDGNIAEIHDIGLLDLWPIETGNEFDVTIGREFKGLIDDVRIYDRALSEDEINALYKLRSNRPLPKSR